MLLDEQHSATIVSLDGVTTTLATARLNETDTLEGFRDEVANAAGRAANDVLDAFDAAFEQCEAVPGNTVTVDVTCATGTVRVQRLLAA